MAAINFPDAPTNGQIFESGGMSWTYVAGIGWTLNSAIVEAGSGFTFIADTMPLPVNVGDTWFDSSTGASGGTSWVAVEEGPAGASEKVWVQFAPGIGASPTPETRFMTYRSFTTGAVSIVGSTTTGILFVDSINDGYGGIGNPAAGVMTLPKGIFSIAMTMRFATTFGSPGIVAQICTYPGGSPVATLPGHSPWGVPQFHWLLDQTVEGSPNQYSIQVYNYMATMACNSCYVVATRINERV